MQHEDLEANEIYRQSVKAFQEGRWEEAIGGFKTLLQIYGENEEIRNLLSEAKAKAALSGGRNTQGIGWRRRNLLAVVGAVLFLLALAGGFRLISAYKARVEKDAKYASTQRMIADYVTSGNRELAENRYEEAEKDFQRALDLDPDQEMAKEGLKKARKLENARRLFDEAESARGAGELEKALNLFKKLREEYPDFRDVSGEISEIENQIENRDILKKAGEAFELGNWSDAARLYSSFVRSNPDKENDEIESRLYVSYLKLGEELIRAKPAGVDSVRQAAQMFRNALRWKPRDPKASTYLDMIEKYQEGDAALHAGNLDAAISLLRGLYMKAPDLLGGAVAEELYAAYLSRGEKYEQAHEYTLAYQQYILASELNVKDKTDAKRRMLMLGLFLTPTPTATPTPTPTPTPAPTPTPGPLSWYKGDIVFLSDRDGSEGLYLMPPSGKWVRRLPDEYRQEYEELRKQERFAPGRKARVYAEGVGLQEEVQIFVWRYDIPKEWGPRRQLTDSPQPDYDPVWSPTGEWIAFVSERTGNDEIWIIHPDGTGLKQLTHNTWEWDKHPSWSPDGKQIVFWSNRKVGRKQIWIMNLDGSDQHDISNDQWNDWDPIWIK